MPHEDSRLYDHGIIAAFLDAIHSPHMIEEVNGNKYEKYFFTKKRIEYHFTKHGESPSNIPDVIYSYRVGRVPYPDEMKERGNWVIDGAGKGKYYFVKVGQDHCFDISPDDKEVVCDRTPPLVIKHAQEIPKDSSGNVEEAEADEQAALVRARYNDLVGRFLDLSECHHMQSHVRKFITGRGQVEIDDLYIGRDSNNNDVIIPIEAKNEGEDEHLGIYQLLSLVRFAAQVFPDLTPKPVGLKIVSDDTIAMAAFNATQDYDSLSILNSTTYHIK